MFNMDFFGKDVLRGVRWQRGWVAIGSVGQFAGEQRSQGQRLGKPDFGTVRWETQYVGYTGDDRTAYWVLTAQYVGYTADDRRVYWI